MEPVQDRPRQDRIRATKRLEPPGDRPIRRVIDFAAREGLRDRAEKIERGFFVQRLTEHIRHGEPLDVDGAADDASGAGRNEDHPAFELPGRIPARRNVVRGRNADDVEDGDAARVGRQPLVEHGGRHVDRAEIDRIDDDGAGEPLVLAAPFGMTWTTSVASPMLIPRLRSSRHFIPIGVVSSGMIAPRTVCTLSARLSLPQPAAAASASNMHIPFTGDLMNDLRMDAKTFIERGSNPARGR